MSRQVSPTVGPSKGTHRIGVPLSYITTISNEPINPVTSSPQAEQDVKMSAKKTLGQKKHSLCEKGEKKEKKTGKKPQRSLLLCVDSDGNDGSKWALRVQTGSWMRSRVRTHARVCVYVCLWVCVGVCVCVCVF